MIFFSVKISWEYPHSVIFAYIFLSTAAASFVEILEFYGEFWKALDKKDNTTCLYVCLWVSKSKIRKNRWTDWEIFQGFFKKDAHEEFHNTTFIAVTSEENVFVAL